MDLCHYFRNIPYKNPSIKFRDSCQIDSLETFRSQNIHRFVFNLLTISYNKFDSSSTIQIQITFVYDLPRLLIKKRKKERNEEILQFRTWIDSFPGYSRQ